MQRRKFIVGMGSLAAGSAAAVGTGAFSSVTASRDIDVAVASDARAYLRIEGRDDATEHEEYITEDGEDGTLTLQLDGDDTAAGAGVNPDAVTQIDHLFVIQNQGTQDVDVSLDKTGKNAGLVEFYANGTTSAAAPYETSSGSTTVLGGSAYTLHEGESLFVSIQVDTTDSGLTDGDTLLDAVTINAEA